MKTLWSSNCILVCLLTVGAVQGQFCFAAEIPQGFSVFFTDAAHGLGGTLKPSVIDAVNSATHTLELCTYTYDSTELTTALCAAAERLGLGKVRVIMDQEYAAETREALEPCGIEVRDDAEGPDPTDRIMHNKFIIVDGLKVWIGSANMNNNSFTRQANNAVLIESAEIAGEYLIEFEQMWAGKFGTEKTQHTRNEFVVNGVEVACYFGPQDNIYQALIDQLALARNNVAFSMYYFTKRSISDALLQAKRDYGIRVRGVMYETSSYSEYSYLLTNGCDIRKWSQPCPRADLLHHKFVVINYHYPLAESMVLSGSANWTHSGTSYQHDENIFIIKNNEIAEDYYQEFVKNFYGTNEEEEAEVALTLNSSQFFGGDRLVLTAQLQNTCQAQTVLAFVALDVGINEYWFAPLWVHYPPDVDSYSTLLIGNGGRAEIKVLDLHLPDPLPAGGPYYFYSALRDELNQETLGELAIQEFRFY